MRCSAPERGSHHTQTITHSFTPARCPPLAQPPRRHRYIVMFLISLRLKPYLLARLIRFDTRSAFAAADAQVPVVYSFFLFSVRRSRGRRRCCYGCGGEGVVFAEGCNIDSFHANGRLTARGGGARGVWDVCSRQTLDIVNARLSPLCHQGNPACIPSPPHAPLPEPPSAEL